MRNVNFWISSVTRHDDGLFLSGINFKEESFQIKLTKITMINPADLRLEECDEGSFVVWDGLDFWRIEITLANQTSAIAASEEAISDTEFRYDSYGLSPIIFSQITGAIVANL